MIVRGNLLSDPALPMHHPTNKARQIASARPAQVLPVQTMNLFLTDSPRCRRDESMRKDFSRSSSPLVRRQQPLSPKLSSLPSRLPDPFDMTSRSSIASRTKPVRTLTSLVRSKSQLSRYSHRLPELHSSRFNPEERSAISQSLHVDKMQLEILKKKSVHPQFTTDEWDDAKSNVAVIVDDECDDDDDDSVRIRRSPRASPALSFDASHLTLPSIDAPHSPGIRIPTETGRRSSLRRRQYTFVLPTLAEQIDNEQNCEQTT